MKWGILGSGKIARIFADGLARSRTGTLHAVASRDEHRARALAAEFGAARAYGSYDELMADGDVDIVYVATPHPTHLELAGRAARRGKHLLCEKPLTVTAAQARELIEVADDAGVFLMEAFAFRCHPQTAHICDVVASGALGDVRFFDASFGYDAGTQPGNYLLRPELAGGSILDVGCYTVAMVQLLAGAEPVQFGAAAHVGAEDRCDHYAVATLGFDSGLVAQIACAVQLNLPNTLTVRGTRGALVVDSPWLPGRLGEETTVTLTVDGASEQRTFALDDGLNLYALEADHVAGAVADGRRESPAMSWRDTVEVMTTLDRWHDAIAVTYA